MTKSEMLATINAKQNRENNFINITEKEVEEMTYKELIKEAMEELENNDELFCEMVDELDSWDGFADGFRCYDMYELDDLFCDMKVSDFLSKLGDFNYRDNYFYYSIYGIESTNDKTQLYRDNVDTGELLDNVIENANHLYFSDNDFEELINKIQEAREEETA